MNFTLKTRLLFFEKLSTLVGSGVSVLQSLEVVRKRERGKMQAAVAAVQSRVHAGETLAESLAPSGLADRTHLAILKACEKIGRLDEGLIQVAGDWKLRMALSAKAKAGLLYPAFMVHLGILIPSVLVLVRQDVQAFAFYLAVGFGALYTVFFLIWLLYKCIQASQITRCAAWCAASYLPIVGTALKQLATARFLRGLAGGTSAGLSVPEAVAMASESSGHPVWPKKASKAYELFSQGHTLTEVLEKFPLPNLALRQIEVGETSGKLPEVLGKMAEAASDDAERAAQRMASGMCAFVYISAGALVLYQIFDTYSKIYQ